MLQRALIVGLLLAGYTFFFSQADAFDAGGVGAGCGGGIGSSYSCSGFTSGSFGCTGYGGGYTGWTYGGGTSGYGGSSYLGRGYKGWGLASTHEKSPPVARSAPRRDMVRASYRTQGADAKAVVLTVSLPADAKLFINDLPTVSTGEVRHFASTQFPAGRVYRYRLRAEIINDGVPVVEERVVRLSAGQDAAVAFARPEQVPIGEVAATSPR